MIDAEKVLFLQSSLASEVAHSGDNLLQHLIGTASLLDDWGCDQETIDGGLYHSVYGTETFRSTLIPLDRRKSISRVIGERAERLAYLFCIMVKRSLDDNLDGDVGYSVISRLDGATIPIDAEDFESLCHISFANWIEQRERHDQTLRAYRADAFRRMLHLMKPGAVLAFHRAYGSLNSSPRSPPRA